MSESSNVEQEVVKQDEQRPARRAYRAPQLRHLGSIRELTLGASVGMPEGGGTLIRAMGMM